MQWNPTKTAIAVAGGVIGILVAAVCCKLLLGDRVAPSEIPKFGGGYPEPKATAVIAALGADAPGNMNVVWCASFLCAWKVLEAYAMGPITLEGTPSICASLNAAADPRPSIPEEALYAAADWNHTDVLDRIRTDLRRKFPHKAPPTFPAVAPDSFVAYAYLEANVRFTLPYFQNSRPLVFSDRAGVRTEVSSFGIRREDAYAYSQLRRQPAVLLGGVDEHGAPREYVIDLDRASQPSQIVVALLDSRLSFADKVARVEKEIAAGGGGCLGPNDVLLVPDTLWSITHRFRELEGRQLMEGPLKGQRIELAEQEIQFRLDRSGAELKSEAKVIVTPIPALYIFDRPFLVYMKRRGAPGPYFVLWVENAELLRKWEAGKS